MRVTKEVATTEIRRGSRVDVYARVRSQRVPSTESKQYAKSAQHRWSTPAEQYCKQELQQHAMRPLYEALDLSPQGGKNYNTVTPRP